MSDNSEAHFEATAAEEISTRLAMAASEVGIDIARFPVVETPDLPEDVLDFVDGRGRRFRFNIWECTTQDVVACLAEHLKREEEMPEDRERPYRDGQKQAWVTILQLALSHVCESEPLLSAAAMIVQERAETVLKLREICELWGDNNWEDATHLADVLDKHLAVHLTPLGMQERGAS